MRKDRYQQISIREQAEEIVLEAISHEEGQGKNQQYLDQLLGSFTELIQADPVQAILKAREMMGISEEITTKKVKPDNQQNRIQNLRLSNRYAAR